MLIQVVNRYIKYVHHTYLRFFHTLVEIGMELLRQGRKRIDRMCHWLVFKKSDPVADIYISEKYTLYGVLCVCTYEYINVIWNCPELSENQSFSTT